MNLKTGIDIIEVNRIQENIEKYGEKFLNRIYTNNEINYCESKKTQKFQSYAGRFAAKEAVFKALSEFLDNKFEIEWKDIEVINDKNGRPSVNFYGILTEIITLKNNIDVSISHIKDIAIASAIIKLDN